MGYTTYDADYTRSFVETHARKGTDTFVHTSAISSGRAAKEVHKNLDPAHKNAAGIIVRESRDSDQHPNSRAIAIAFDVTGSMETCPRIFLNKLPNLMQLLIRKDIVSNPHILFAAVGDHNFDAAPLQVGQFEGGNEVTDSLSNTWLENGGGWLVPEESYELVMYFLAQYAEMDCLIKRGQKGYLFMLGDERPHKVVSAATLEKLTGERPQADISTEDVLAKLREKFNVFWIMPGGTLHANDNTVITPLKKMFGQQFVRLENPENVCELIATIIGIGEGRDAEQLAADLREVGADEQGVASAQAAVADLEIPETAPAPVGASGAVVNGEIPGGGTAE